jgi:hypothetical protein
MDLCTPAELEFAIEMREESAICSVSHDLTPR